MLLPPLADVTLAVVEDDHRLREDLCAYFSWRGAQVSAADSAEAFWAQFDVAAPPDLLLLLDLGLPGVGGLELAHSLRRRTRRVGIVMLTAFGSDTDRIAGLQGGADAYVVKGVSLELLEATCRSVLRRTLPSPVGVGGVTSPAESTSAWRLDALKAQLTAPGGQAVQLTHLELIFLSALMAQPGTAVARAALLERMGRPHDAEQLRTLDGCAARLRRKVQALEAEELPVRSYYGRGYAFGAPAVVST